jgi:mannose-6-phosphate isomerase-like protein (cupin superfamily)
MDPIKDASHLFEFERLTHHAERPGFRITELQISPIHQVPWHCHSNIQDTFYVIDGHLSLFLREPKEEVRLAPGETYSVRPRRPHLVRNGGTALQLSSSFRASVSTIMYRSCRCPRRY